MFTFLFLVLIGLGAYVLIKGFAAERKSQVAAGAVILLASVILFWFLDFWGERLWFNAIDYDHRFWTLFWSKAAIVASTAVAGAGLVTLLLLPLPGNRKLLRYAALGLSAVVGGLWGFGNWSTILQWWFRVNTELVDPIIGQDTGFYLFSLPFWDSIYSVLIILSVIALVASALSRYRLIKRDENDYQIALARDADERRINRSLYINGGILLLLAAAGKFLDRFHLMYSDLGAVSGPGWTDVNIILPTYWVMILLTALLGIALFLPAGRGILQRLLTVTRINDEGNPLYTVGMAGLLVLAFWFVGLTLIPGAFQSFRVEPNEISYEEPYILNNIEFTKHGFNLHQVEDQEFPAVDTFTRQMVQNNRSIFNNIRLWDWRALDAVLQQFQEIRLYYEFNDVDIDRYTYGGQYRQVMVSAREMMPGNLPAGSQTFVNEVFKYTHGYGIAMSTVTDFTEEGLPNLLIKNIPPEAKYEELAVDQPRIYYGELTDSYVITNSTEQEFDYPRGEQNEYINYAGSGGVQLSNFFRKVVYAYKMDDFKLLLSSYPTSESRLMFKRQIEERVRTLAPFLEFDGDPYVVNADGQLYWMVDAYTTSRYFPYSEPFTARETIEYKDGEQQRVLRVQHNPAFAGMNYMRNSVKAVVNAYNGDVNFYVFDEEDPIIQVWDNIFPGLLKKRSEMPESLLAHIRYPSDFLLTQGLVYAKYHMNDPEVFYNQEDLWIRATEKYYGDVQPVEPYYIMWQRPEADHAEFTIILPFTPKNRQVAIGWIAGLCDPGNYGRFLAYSFPKEKRVLGPQQVETKIDQNSYLSGQLSLWDQRGSSVIRGNVLAIPVENTIIYVEPIYLQAETAAYPELRLVCVMHDDQLSYAENFQEALEGIFGEAPPAPVTEAGAPVQQTISNLIQRANQAFQNYMQATGQGNFQEASGALEQLRQSLDQLSQQQTQTVQDTTGS